MKYYVDNVEVTIEELEEIREVWEDHDIVYGHRILALDCVYKEGVYFEKREYGD